MFKLFGFYESTEEANDQAKTTTPKASSNVNQ